MAMGTTLRSKIAVKLVHNTMATLVVLSGLYVATVTAPTVQQDAHANVVECFNPHTAQITTEVGDTCPVPVNPYQ